MGGGSEVALHCIISNRINERVKLSSQSEYFLTVGRNLYLEIKTIHCKYVRNHSGKYTVLKKNLNFMEEIQPIESCWLLAFHICEHTKAWSLEILYAFEWLL